jgi:hypothetical protein
MTRTPSLKVPSRSVAHLRCALRQSRDASLDGPITEQFDPCSLSTQQPTLPSSSLVPLLFPGLVKTVEIGYNYGFLG